MSLCRLCDGCYSCYLRCGACSLRCVAMGSILVPLFWCQVCILCLCVLLYFVLVDCSLDMFVSEARTTLSWHILLLVV